MIGLPLIHRADRLEVAVFGIAIARVAVNLVKHTSSSRHIVLRAIGGGSLESLFDRGFFGIGNASIAANRIIDDRIGDRNGVALGEERIVLIESRSLLNIGAAI